MSVPRTSLEYLILDEDAQQPLTEVAGYREVNRIAAAIPQICRYDSPMKATMSNKNRLEDSRKTNEGFEVIRDIL